MDKFYVREYIPGYTGHISKKQGTFGITAGEINRQLILNQKVNELIPDQRLYYTRSQGLFNNLNNDKKKFGFTSREAISWISGPTHDICKQHIPCIIINKNNIRYSISRACSINSSRKYLC